MVFVGNVQKSPIASHLKSLDPSLDFCCQGPALTGIKEGRLEERPHQLNLRSKRAVLVPPYDLQSRKSCCCPLSKQEQTIERLLQVLKGR